MIYQVGAPILRQQAQPVTDIFAPSIRTLSEQMFTVMMERSGVGIAAPQLGHSLQMLIIASRPNQRYPSAPHVPPLLMLNPVWLSHSPATEIGEEGCLSVPDRRELVERYQEVTVQFWDLQGQWHIQTLTGFPARIFQHEYDHLQGTLFLDRVRQMAVN